MSQTGTSPALEVVPEKADIVDSGFLGIFSEEEFDRLLDSCGIIDEM